MEGGGNLMMFDEQGPPACKSGNAIIDNPLFLSMVSIVQSTNRADSFPVGCEQVYPAERRYVTNKIS